MTINKEFLYQFSMYKLSFETLIKEQETLETLIQSEKNTIKYSGTKDKNKLNMLENDEIITNLKH
jgi:hypothetical protein